MRMNGKIERGKRIVGKDEIRLKSEREGNENEMEMKEGKLMGVEIDGVWRKLKMLKWFEWKLKKLGISEDELDIEELNKDLENSNERRKRGERIMKYILNKKKMEENLKWRKGWKIGKVENDMEWGRIDKEKEREEDSCIEDEGLKKKKEKLEKGDVEGKIVKNFKSGDEGMIVFGKEKKR